MSIASCGGYVPMTYTTENDQYFIRDDRDAGCCDYERYSLFLNVPKADYGRIAVYSGSLYNAMMQAPKDIKDDRQARELKWQITQKHLEELGKLAANEDEDQDECGCDLCQCFGEGNCVEHENECNWCNNGNDPEDCTWLGDI